MNSLKPWIARWLAIATAASTLGLPLARAATGEEEGWRIVREVDGVEVARLAGSKGGGSDFRGTTVFDASLPQVLAVLRDVPRHVEWRSRCVESPFAPNPDGAVRIDFEGGYALQALDPHRTRVEYRMRLDLGGRVPGWIARFAAEDMPLATLTGLGRQVAKTDGVYEAFARAWSEAAARGEIPPLR